MPKASEELKDLTKRERQLLLAKQKLQFIELEMDSVTEVTEEMRERYKKAVKDVKKKQNAVNRAIIARNKGIDARRRANKPKNTDMSGFWKP